jgi:DUF4097 and DUF4098 domain-containing protein YvlB
MKIFLLLAALSSLSLSAKVTENFAQNYPISPTGTIQVENVNGSVDIIAWEKNEVQLEAVKTAPAKEDLDHIHLKIEASPDRLSVKTEYDRKRFLGNYKGEVKYTLHVPAHAQLDAIRTVNAGMHIQNVLGPVNLHSVNGPLRAEGLSAAGHFESVNGGMDVSYASLSGVDNLELHTVNGGCTLTLPKDAAFELNSHTVNGGVHSDDALKVTKSGKGHFRAGTGGPSINFHSVNGGLHLRSS